MQTTPDGISERGRQQRVEQPAQKKSLSYRASSLNVLIYWRKETHTADTKTHSAATSNAGDRELEYYLVEPVIPQISNMRTLWRKNKNTFLAAMAHRQLVTPLSNVPPDQ